MQTAPRAWRWRRLRGWRSGWAALPPAPTRFACRLPGGGCLRRMLLQSTIPCMPRGVLTRAPLLWIAQATQASSSPEVESWAPVVAAAVSAAAAGVLPAAAPDLQASLVRVLAQRVQQMQAEGGEPWWGAGPTRAGGAQGGAGPEAPAAWRRCPYHVSGVAQHRPPVLPPESQAARHGLRCAGRVARGGTGAALGVGRGSRRRRHLPPRGRRSAAAPAAAAGGPPPGRRRADCGRRHAAQGRVAAAAARAALP